MFFISSGVCVLGWIVYLIFADATEQEWAKVGSVYEEPTVKGICQADRDKLREVLPVSGLKSAEPAVLKSTQL